MGESLRVEEVEKPAISSREVLVRIKACGICHTDLHFIDEGLNKPGKIPQIVGHEAAGDAVEVGKDVEDISICDRVLIHLYFSCGECYYCLRGRESLCASPDFKHFGFTTDGGYAEYAKAPARSILKLPDEVPYEAGILVDAGSTAYHAVRQVSGVRLGDTVALVGTEELAFAHSRWPSLAGPRARVDIKESKLKAAKSLGADHAINSAVEDLVAGVRRLTGGRGVDFVCEFVG